MYNNTKEKKIFSHSETRSKWRLNKYSLFYSKLNVVFIYLLLSRFNTFSFQQFSFVLNGIEKYLSVKKK